MDFFVVDFQIMHSKFEVVVKAFTPTLLTLRSTRVHVYEEMIRGCFYNLRNNFVLLHVYTFMVTWW